jgi:hypothetical protein
MIAQPSPNVKFQGQGLSLGGISQTLAKNPLPTPFFASQKMREVFVGGILTGTGAQAIGEKFQRKKFGVSPIPAGPVPIFP